MRTPEQKLIDRISLYEYLQEVTPDSLNAVKLENAKKELAALNK